MSTAYGVQNNAYLLRCESVIDDIEEANLVHGVPGGGGELSTSFWGTHLG